MPLLNNFALDYGLKSGHLDYGKFIILGRSRSGSNLLRGLLNSHSQITVYGEIFQNKKSIGWALSGYRQNPKMMDEFLHQPVNFINTKVFHKFPAEIKAVGFKIFYYHAHDDEWEPVWQYLIENKELAVIHIKRRNILKTHLSRLRAVQNDKWVNTSGEYEENPPLTIDYEQCLEDFITTRASEDNYDRLFQDHPKMVIYYEDLARDYQLVMDQVQSFLGVDHQQLTPETFVQSVQPLSAAITNYDELKTRFYGTPWEEFFEE